MKSKALKVISTATLAATLVVPVAPAFAASTYTTGSNPAQATPGGSLSGVRVVVEITPGSITTTNDTVRFRLPANSYAATPSATAPTLSGTGTANQVSAPSVTPIGTAVGGQYNEFSLTVTKVNSTDKGLIYLDFPSVTVPSGTNGKFELNFDAQSGTSGFSSGAVTLANVGSGTFATTIDDVNPVNIGSTGYDIAPIRIKEDRPGALRATSKSVKIKLPNGFKWANSGTDLSDVAVNQVWGDVGNNVHNTTSGATTNQIHVVKADDRTVYLDLSNGFGTGTPAASTVASYFTINGLKVVADDSDAKTGDVEVTISGDSSAANSSLVIARYGNFTSAVSAATAKNVYAGATDQDISDITIKEDSPGTLLKDRAVKLTLSGGAKWHRDTAGNPVGPRIKNADSSLYGLNIGSWSWSGTDYTSIIANVDSPSTSKPSTLVLEKGKIDAGTNANSDIKVAVSGTASVSGEAVVAKAQAPVTVEVGAPKDIVIGTQDQAISDIVIKETASSNIDKGNLVLEFPTGVTPTAPTSVSVTEGDIKIDASNVTKNGRTITIPVTLDSAKPSVIKVSGIKLAVDRTVPEGDLKVKLNGSSLLAGYTIGSGLTATTYNPFPVTDSVASGVVAKVTTPAEGKGTASTIKFKLGATSYTVDGVDKTMDVAPFAENNRTYLPIRFAADALGATNVQWDQNTKTVTVFKQGNIVQMKLGEKAYYLNGVRVPMDVAVVAKNQRVVLPIRFLGDALNVPVNYDEAAGEITLGAK